MIDFRPVLFILGILLSAFGAIPAFFVVLSLLTHSVEWPGFLLTFIIGIFIGGILIINNIQAEKKLNIKQAFVTTSLAWVCLPLLGALPLYLSSTLHLSFVDAFFEAASGITTTGATILTSLETTDPALLLWRSLLQWLGGIGIVVMAMAIFPILQIGGMQMFKSEFSEKIEKGLPKSTTVSLSITLLYIGLTIICIIAYYIAGMKPFDALNHAMTTVSTGGFSTHDSSFAWFSSYKVHIVGVIFMILGSLPFILYLRVFDINISVLWQDTQVKLFIILLLCVTLIAWFTQSHLAERPLIEGFVASIFNVTSVMTGTGYASENYSTWPYFPPLLFLFLMFTGGCAGSTTCGVKIFRIHILAKTGLLQLRRILQPNHIHIITYNNRVITQDVQESVISFLILFIIIFAILAVLLNATGMNFLSSISAAAAAIANVGPGLGPNIGPIGTYADLLDTSKVLLIIGMIIGRLEIFTVLVLLAPSFWHH